ncbi:MAG TPA: cytochrome P450 [Candidatus Acidoferrales bacterium]|nr:cytochrome P450 [Candidatus Acidoferrales bacterium]
MPKILRPEGPKGRWLIGVTPLTSGDRLKAMTDWAREYGDIYHCRFLGYHVYFLNRPEYIEQVLVTHQRKFMKGRALQANRELFGNGLLTSEGDFWQRQRKLSQPAFHRARIQSYAKTMVDCTVRAMEGWRAGEERDIHQDMMALTLDIAARTLFSVEIGAMGARIRDALEELLEVSARPERILKPLRVVSWRSEGKYRRAIAELDKIVYGIIAERRASGRDTGDLLSMLLAARDDEGKGMSDQQLRDELLTLLLAGHETTALALSWTWYLLANHPEAEKLLHQEVDAAFAGAAPRVEDLPRLPYTEKVVKEALRLYPPAYVILRLALEPVEIAGYALPAGSSVGMSPWVVHHDARYFPEPEKFLPERWTESFAQKLPRFAYFPFGGGPRICIGAQFAMMEAVLVLATIASRYRLGVAAGHKIELFPSITLRPKNGIRAKVETRGAVLN